MGGADRQCGKEQIVPQAGHGNLERIGRACGAESAGRGLTAILDSITGSSSLVVAHDGTVVSPSSSQSRLEPLTAEAHRCVLSPRAPHTRGESIPSYANAKTPAISACGARGFSS